MRDGGLHSAEHLYCSQSELRAANMTWNFYAYGRTVHAFTLMENPLWNGNKSQVNHCAQDCDFTYNFPSPLSSSRAV